MAVAIKQSDLKQYVDLCKNCYIGNHPQLPKFISIQWKTSCDFGYINFREILIPTLCLLFYYIYRYLRGSM